MSLRMLGSALLLVALAAFKFPAASPAGQAGENPTTGSKWEYKILRMDANHCYIDEEVARSLNIVGQDGWDLVNYERLELSFPRDAQGTLLIRPAATGVGRDSTPQTADSFQGTIKMNMAQSQPGACRFLFKRLWRANRQ
jgi:hypothetical protein